jgi:two-component system chemotaxis response regulator CheB
MRSDPPGEANPVRILVIESSAGFRKDLTDAIRALPGAEVAGISRGGEDGLECADRLKPDIVVLELDPPSMDGRETFARLMLRHPGACIILIGFAKSLPLLRELGRREDGHSAFLVKADHPGAAADREALRSAMAGFLARFRKKRSGPVTARPALSAPSLSGMRCVGGGRPAVVAIGASTGGPKALETVLSGLPGNFPAPILIVQHIQAGMTAFMVGALSGKIGIPIEEGAHGRRVEPGRAYLAPGGKQMKVELDGEHRPCLALCDDPPENFCKPSADCLFRSVAAVYGGCALGVILTGIGNDGAAGLLEMKRHGAKVIGQDEATCVVYGMPKAAREAGAVDVELPLDGIAKEIMGSMGA